MAQRENKVDIITEYIDLLYHELKIRFGEEPQIKDMLSHIDLSIKYDITERTAQNIVYKERNKSVLKRNVR